MRIFQGTFKDKTVIEVPAENSVYASSLIRGYASSYGIKQKHFTLTEVTPTPTRKKAKSA